MTANAKTRSTGRLCLRWWGAGHPISSRRNLMKVDRRLSRLAEVASISFGWHVPGVAGEWILARSGSRWAGGTANSAFLFHLVCHPNLAEFVPNVPQPRVKHVHDPSADDEKCNLNGQNAPH